jgi:hypothetical protein
MESHVPYFYLIFNIARMKAQQYVANKRKKSKKKWKKKKKKKEEKE